MVHRTLTPKAKSWIRALSRSAASFLVLAALDISASSAFAGTAACQTIYEDCKVFAKEKQPAVVQQILTRCEILYKYAQTEHLWASEKAQAAAGYKRPIKQLFCL